MAKLDHTVIVTDLDGTLCEIKKDNETYSEVAPKSDYVNILNNLKDCGAEIIVETARNMLTRHNDESKVIKNVGLDTLNWLDKNNVKYDGIKFGKTCGTCYVDDKALRPKEFIKIYNSLHDKSDVLELEQAIKEYLRDN